MNRCFCTFIAIASIAIGATAAHAQTVTVAQSGGNFTTVQAAINSFTPDGNAAPNIIQITDSSLYDEIITVNAPVTIEGTATPRPILAVQANPAGRSASAGLVINLPNTITSDTVALKNLIVIPSLIQIPQSCGINVFNNNAFVSMEGILLTGNDGTNNPVSADGLSAVTPDVAHAYFGDDGIVAGETDASQFEGAGVEISVKNSVITNLHGVAGARTDGILMVNSGSAGIRSVNMGDGCVISYLGNSDASILGYGVTVTGDFHLDAPNTRALLTGLAYGIFFDGDSPNTRLVRGANIVFNSRSAIYESSSTGVRMTAENCIFAQNARHNVWLLGTATSPVTFKNVTIALQQSGSYNAIRIAPEVTANVDFENSIIGGLASGNSSDNIIYNESASAVNLTNTAIILAGQAYLYNTGFLNDANVVGTSASGADPGFVNVADPLSSDFFDVNSPSYASIGSGGAPLSGGADFVGYAGPITPVVKTVSKSGTPDFSTIQDALNSLVLDNTKHYTVQILDDSVYDEMLEINVPVTLEGTGTNRPVLAVQSNPNGFDNDGTTAGNATEWAGDAGLLINIPETVSTCSIALKNLIIIPSRNSTSGTPPVAGIVNKANNFFLSMENLLVTSNDGSDAPVSSDGLSDAGVVNTSFLVTGGNIGSITNSRPEGAGVTVFMRDCVFTNIKSTLGASWMSGFYMYRTYYITGIAPGAGEPLRPWANRHLTVGDGCVFSFNNGTGLRCAASLEIDAPNQRMLAINNGFTGLWLDMTHGTDIVNGLISSGNGQMGINEGVGNSGPRAQINHAIIVNNGWYGTYHRLGSSSQTPTTIKNTTIANNSLIHGSTNQVQSSSAGSNIALVATDVIITGDGETSKPSNIINWTSHGTMTFNNVAVVTAGLFALSDPPISSQDLPNPVGDPVTNEDPNFANTTDPTSPDFYAVQNQTYVNLSSTGGPLSGGAAFIPAAAVYDWSVY